MTVKTSFTIAFIILLAAIFLTDTNLIIFVIDSALFIISRLSRVAEINEQEPNYVMGNWQPIHNELDRVSVHGKGKLPASLKGGMYVRAGANIDCWPPGDGFIHHAFTGYAMHHRIEILNEDKVLFSNSWIRGEHMNLSTWKPMRKCPYRMEYGDIINGGFLLLPKIFLLRLKNRLLGVKETVMEKRYPGSTSIVRHAHRTLACTEVFLPYEILIKRDGVDSIGFTDFDGFLKQSEGSKYVPFPAHPRIDPVTKELYFVSRINVPAPLPQLFFGFLHSNGTPSSSLHIPLENPMGAMYHDILLTKNYVIIIDGSLRSDMSRISEGKGVVFFNKTKELRFGVLPRVNPSLKNLRWIVSTRPGHVYHTISAWENEDQTITAFMPKFDEYNDNLDIHLSSEKPSYLTKFTLDLKTGKASEERLLDDVVERPSFNTGLLSPTITYLRSEGGNSGEMGTEVIKYDLKNEKLIGRFQCKEECIFGEAFFVPSNGKTANVLEEDDGYLMDIVYHPKTNISSFVVINAKTMNKDPSFIATLPQRVPYGVHGIWLDNDYFKTQKNKN